MLIWAMGPVSTDELPSGVAVSLDGALAVGFDLGANGDGLFRLNGRSKTNPTIQHRQSASAAAATQSQRLDPGF